MTNHSRPRPLVLAILDGWGERDEREGNAIKLANTPNIDAWRATYPMTLLQASERSVGLPTGQIGTSEVGHLNLGAGFVVMQTITFIDEQIEDGSFFENEAFLKAVDHVKGRNSRLHIIGLLGTGGVHSHLRHEKALLELAKRNGLADVFVHVFTDGRDTMPTSGLGFLQDLEAYMTEQNIGTVASVMGRYYAMDRDFRWERTKLAYDAMVTGEGQKSTNAQAAIQQSYDTGVTDEFIVPTVITAEGAPVGQIRDGDSVICFNFRADRARQITQAFVLQDFGGFARETLHDLFYVAMRVYQQDVETEVAFDIKEIEIPLAQVISNAGLKQLHVAETEKYAHVTYFFNGGNETPYPGEDRQLVPSPKEVPTYDLKPEMSAFGIRDTLLAALDQNTYDFIIVNFANADMVGHTGVLPAVITACETIDTCLGPVIAKVLELGGAAIITADHGNAELLIDPATGGPHTAHTTNPVPCILITPEGAGYDHATLRNGGVLSDVALTVLDLLQITPPAQMTSRSLIVHADTQ
jgi:2,3-bisphosphoglycerate-independent phosphoglycerate mutase